VAEADPCRLFANDGHKTVIIANRAHRDRLRADARWCNGLDLAVRLLSWRTDPRASHRRAPTFEIARA